MVATYPGIISTFSSVNAFFMYLYKIEEKSISQNSSWLCWQGIFVDPEEIVFTTAGKITKYGEIVAS